MYNALIFHEFKGLKKLLCNYFLLHIAVNFFFLQVLEFLVLEEADTEEIGDKDDTIVKLNRVIYMQNPVMSFIVVFEWIAQLLHEFTLDFCIIIVHFGWAADFGGAVFLLVLYIPALEHLSKFSSFNSTYYLIFTSDLCTRSEHLKYFWVQILILTFASFTLSGCKIRLVVLIFSELVSILIAFCLVNIVRLGDVRLNILILSCELVT